MAKEKIITLLTDFGMRDPYLAAMKGVILQGCPAARIVDVSHDIPRTTCWRLRSCWAGGAVLSIRTLHVAVVDPGVGTERKILAAKFDASVSVPRHGVITLLAQTMELEAIVVVRNTKYLPRSTRR